MMNATEKFESAERGLTYTILAKLVIGRFVFIRRDLPGASLLFLRTAPILNPQDKGVAHRLENPFQSLRTVMAFVVAQYKL